MISRLTGLLLLSALFAAGEQVEKLVLTDLTGRKHDPFAAKDTVAAVLVFVSVDCPIANFYQPSLRKLAAKFGARGVVFFQVHPDPDLEAADAKKHAAEYGLSVPVIIDAGQALVRRLDAEVTPEAFVLTRDHAVAYRGRIDNTYTTFGKRRPKPTKRDLEAALTAVLAGKKVPTPKTKAIGCQIFVEK